MGTRKHEKATQGTYPQNIVLPLYYHSFRSYILTNKHTNIRNTLQNKIDHLFFSNLY